jgi:hypothetical protein
MILLKKWNDEMMSLMSLINVINVINVLNVMKIKNLIFYFFKKIRLKCFPWKYLELFSVTKFNQRKQSNEAIEWNNRMKQSNETMKNKQESKYIVLWIILDLNKSRTIKYFMLLLLLLLLFWNMFLCRISFI